MPEKEYQIAVLADKIAANSFIAFQKYLDEQTTNGNMILEDPEIRDPLFECFSAGFLAGLGVFLD